MSHVHPISGFDWFALRSEREAFEELEYSACYAVGVEGGSGVMVGYATNLRDRLARLQSQNPQKLRFIAAFWTMSLSQAMRLTKEVRRIFERSHRQISENWFDLPDHFVRGAMVIAARDNLIVGMTHAEMLQRVRRNVHERMIRTLKKAGYDAEGKPLARYT